MVPAISLVRMKQEIAYHSHVRDPFLKFPDPIGNRRIGDDDQERIDLVFLRSEETDQRCDLNTVLQLLRLSEA